MTKHLVLVGGGHAHMTVLRQCPDYLDLGVHVTLVSAAPYHYYSGMGPGLLAGTYRPQDIRFHVGKMARDRGAEFIEDRVVRIDAKDRQLILRSGGVIGYDLASFNTGSDVIYPIGAQDTTRVFPVKPIDSLLAAQRSILNRIRQGHAEIVVIGGGPAGLEMAGNAWRLVHDRAGQASVTLVTRHRLLSSYSARLQALAHRSLLRRGIVVREGSGVQLIERNAVALVSGERLPADVVIVATGIRPSSLFKDSGLPVGPDGGLLVNHFLQSTSHPEIFGGGDAICFEPRPLSKVGVYAVRENMILYRNILASLTGREMVPFEPQRDFMLIFNTGDGRAILTWRNMVWDGRLAWRLKDRIDRSFMKKFQVSGERDEPLPEEETRHGHH